MLCLYCGAENKSFSKVCGGCSKDISTPAGIKGHLGQLLSAAEKVQDGRIKQVEFQAVVKKMEDITGQVADEFRIPVEDDKNVAHTVNSAQKGIMITLNALKEFNGYLEINEFPPLLRGMDMIKEAYQVSSKSYSDLKKLKENKEAEENSL